MTIWKALLAVGCRAALPAVAGLLEYLAAEVRDLADQYEKARTLPTQ